MEAALSQAIKLEAFEQLLGHQGTLVDHNHGCATYQPCTVCAVTGPSEVGESAAFCKLIKDLQNALTQAMRGMTALATGLWSGHATPLDAASSVGSLLDAGSMPPGLAAGHMASSQPGRGRGRGCGDNRCLSERDLCDV